MVTVSLLALLLGAAPFRLDVAGCDHDFDAAALDRQLHLEWPDPPVGTRIEVQCSGAHWLLVLEAPDRVSRREELTLPESSRSGRARVLALLLAERGRALLATVQAAPEPRPAAAAVPPDRRLPLAPQAQLEQPTLPRGAIATPLRGSFLAVELSDAPPSPWRLGIGGSLQTPFSLGPSRYGAQLRAHRGFLGLSVSGTFGSSAASKTGTVTALAVTVEPELTAACVRAGWWQLCSGARGILGYGVLTSALPTVTPARVEGPVFGGALQLGGSLRLTDRVALDADAVFGATWEMFGSGSVPGAGLGGPFAGASVSLVTSWGAR
jgi:hypothetical protein